MTWRALAPGGVVFGDDWLFPVGAHRDIIHFATEMKDELDDGWGLKVRHIRVLGCVRPGLFVSDRSFQWFMKKLPHVPLAQRSVLDIAVGAKDISGRTWQDCCLEKFGPGNPKCWDVAAGNDSAETHYHGCDWLAAGKRMRLREMRHTLESSVLHLNLAGWL